MPQTQKSYIRSIQVNYESPIHKIILCIIIHKLKIQYLDLSSSDEAEQPCSSRTSITSAHDESSDPPTAKHSVLATFEYVE